ncbi:hypothetical protein RJ639_017878 [Escallonia herrerae]|uniref:Alpha/beta hydrolase fold-3 domain-containing protein n=1 Tax=Escallonia herrerae TaxID=1293975 RepID=A0AA88V9H5_9ASTE|nr:hypothetical protein RJ639_017878 [Escallonia herrerae]
MAPNTKEAATELLPLLGVYTDGTLERLVSSPFVPKTLDETITGVSSKDISISSDVSARLYLPKHGHTDDSQKLPILVYFRLGFCAGSTFSSDHHRYINTLVSQVKILAISVEYRLAQEHPLLTAYEDSRTVLQWVSSHKVRNNIDLESRGICPIIGSFNPVIYHKFRWELQLSGASATNTDHVKGSFLDQEPWLLDHVDFERLFIDGDTTGANIVHNITLRAGIENLHGNAKILGHSFVNRISGARS